MLCPLHALYRCVLAKNSLRAVAFVFYFKGTAFMFLHFRMRPAGDDGWQSDLLTACEQLHPGRLCNVNLQRQAR